MVQDRKPNRPRDPNKLAKTIVDLATMDDDEREALKRKLEKGQTPGKRGSDSARSKEKP